MKIQLLFTTLLLFVAHHGIKAAEIQPRRAPNCALLSNKIYCFGGYILGSSENGVFNSLDIYKNNNGPVQNLNSQWDTVTPNNPSNIAIGRREFPQAAALPDGVSYFIQGGYNYISTVNPQQSIIYNSKTNTLQTAANYVDSNNGGIRQIYYGTGVYLPNLNGVGLYGGYQQHVALGSNYITPEGATLSGLTFNNTDGYGNSYVGYYYFTLYNLQSNTFSVPAQYNVPKDYHISQSVFFHTKSNKVFYIGGSFYNTTASQVYNSYLTYAMTYNTVNGQWLYENIGGNAPSVRKLHTTTLLSNGDDVLLYGGTETGTEAVMDYCYTLSIPLMTWSYRNLVAPVGTSGPRSHHAAVLVNQTSLFIMFGIDRSGNPTNDLLVLDVRNPNNISFATQFPFDNVGGSSNNNNNNNNGNNTNNNNNNNNNQNNNSSSSLGTGAIAGIAVGGIAAGAIAVLAAVCLFRRRRNNNNGGHNTSGTTANYAPQRNNESDLMEVDWDKIDDQYREVNLPPQHQISQAYVGSENHQAHDYYTSSSIGPTGNSLTSSPSNANVGLAGTNSVMSSPSNANASVAGTDTVRSTAISPDFSTSSQFKPDSANYDYPPQSPLSATETAYVSPTVVPDGAPPIVMKSVKPDIGGH